MRKFSFDQKKVIAEFFANGAVAWLAGGVIGPLLSVEFGRELAWKSTVTSFVMLIVFMFAAVDIIRSK